MPGRANRTSGGRCSHAAGGIALVAAAALTTGCGGGGSSGPGSGGATTGSENASSTGSGGGSSGATGQGASSHSQSASASTGASGGGGAGGGPPSCADGEMPLHTTCDDPHYALGESYSCNPPIVSPGFYLELNRVYRFCADYPIPNATAQPYLWLNGYNKGNSDCANMDTTMYAPDGHIASQNSGGTYAQGMAAYQDGKWTIEIVAHLGDPDCLGIVAEINE